MLRATLALLFVSLAPLSLLAACSNQIEEPYEPDPTGLTQRPLISECGGFAAPMIEPPQPDPSTYCDAERLLWAYDRETGELGLTNSRVLLNCCGDHGIQVEKEGEVYVVTERDAPQAAAGGARCGCMCVFDYATVVSPIGEQTISLRLVRNVTDQDPAVTVVGEWTVDLTAGQGSIDVEVGTVEPWCSGAAPQ